MNAGFSGVGQILAGAAAGSAITALALHLNGYASPSMDRQRQVGIGIEKFGPGLNGLIIAGEFARTNGLYIGSLSWSNAYFPKSAEVTAMRTAVSNQVIALDFLSTAEMKR